MYKEQTDDDLLQLLANGNHAAFTELYGRYWRQLYTSARAILHDDSAAEDIVQEVFVSVWRRRKELNILSVRGYLLQATRYQVYKSISAGKTDADFHKRLSQASRQITTDSPVMARELQELLQKLIGSLPEDQRIIFRMNRDEELTYKDIAFKLGISVKTVEKKVSCSLRHIRSGLDR